LLKTYLRIRIFKVNELILREIFKFISKLLIFYFIYKDLKILAVFDQK
jgi:hypothetical protein